MNRKLNRGIVIGISAMALVLASTASIGQGQPAGGGAGAGGGRGAAQPRGGQQPGGARGGGMGVMGQIGGVGNFGGAAISGKDVEKYAKILELSADQLTAVQTLHEGYLAAMKEQSDKRNGLMEKAREEFRESRDPSVWQEMMEAATKIADAQKRIEKTFLDDVRSVLTDKQSGAWTKVERTRRRDETLRSTGGIISGEGVDLVKMVENLKLDDAQMKPIEPTLDRYEGELDSALVNRNKVIEENMGKQRQLMEQVMGGNTEEADKILAVIRDASLKIKDLNKRYGREIEAALPADIAPKFAEEFRKESFPRIYRQSRQAQSVIDASMKFEDLTEAQRAGIQSIADSYKRDNANLNKKAEEAQEASEKTMTVKSMMGGMFGGGGDPAQEELRTSRRELEKKTVDAVKALLTDTQKEQLPPERGNRFNENGGMGGGNGGGGNGGGGNGQPRRPRGNNGGGNGGGGNG